MTCQECQKLNNQNNMQLEMAPKNDVRGNIHKLSVTSETSRKARGRCEAGYERKSFRFVINLFLFRIIISAIY